MSIRSEPSSIAIVVAGYPEEAAVVAGLRSARQRLLALEDEGMRFCSEPMSTPIGVLMLLDAGRMGSSRLRDLPEVIATELESAGIPQAHLDTPPESTRDLSARPSLLYLCAYPRAAAQMLTWLATAVDWLPSRVDAMAVIAWRLEVPAPDPLGLVTQALQGGHSAAIEVPSAEDTFHAIWQSPHGCLLVGVGGPGFGRGDLSSNIDALRRLAMALPDVQYAYISVDADWRVFRTGIYDPPDWNGFMWPIYANQYAGEWVADGLHWQILTEGHLAKLGAPPAGAVDLGDGRWELVVGSPDDWWPDAPWPGRVDPTVSGQPNAVIREKARELVGPLRWPDPGARFRGTPRG